MFAETNRATPAWAEHHLLRLYWRLALTVAREKRPMDGNRLVINTERYEGDHRRPRATGGMLQCGMETQCRRRRLV
jgi:hypothetical protein